MDLTDGRIKNGNSILFLGSGFSREAKNSNMDSVKSAWQLQELMLDECGIIDRQDYDLESSSQEYLDKFGDQAIVDLLHRNFEIFETSRDQDTIVCQPWYRIYTTNYDNAVEHICKLKNKRLTVKEISDKVETPIDDVTQLIHIYGNVSKSSPGEFKKNFLLTESQRNNSPFITSPWFLRFSDDVLFSDSIVFCGFSLKDLDIKRLLGRLPSSVRAKIFFIDVDNLSKPSQDRLSAFGNLKLIGVQGLSGLLAPAMPGPPVRTDVYTPTVLHEFDINETKTRPIASGDIEFLIATGIVDEFKITQKDVTGVPGAYTFGRGEGNYKRATTFARNRPILIHSEIGNGKTVFCSQISFILTSQGYRVFRISREPEKLSEIIQFVQSLSDKFVIILDDLLNFRNLAKSIMRLNHPGAHIIATVRTTLLRTAPSAIEARIGEDYTQVDLNVISKKEAQILDNYLRENSLLGVYSEFDKAESEKFYLNTCGGQVRDIILALFETGVLHEKVKSLLIRIRDLDKELRELTITAALLTMGAGREFSSLPFVAEMIGCRASYDDIRESYSRYELTGLLRIDANDATFKSPALAEFLLRNVFNLDEVLTVAKRFLDAVDGSYGDDVAFDPLSRALLKFSLYGRFVRRARDETLIDQFYTDCRVLSIARRDPLFSVQRSICSMNFDRFTDAYRFVDTAYGMARKIPRYDSFQIETHHAKLLLAESVKGGLSKEVKREKQAQDLLEGVLSKADDSLYHPLSVMRLYGDIIKNHLHLMDTSEKLALKALIERALKRIDAFPKAIFANHPHLPGAKQRLKATVKRLKLH